MFKTFLDNPHLRSILIEVIIALVVLFGDPFGLAEQKTRTIDSGLAIATQYLHAEPPPKLAVMLIDETTLKDWKVDWPLSYGKLADIVHDLACAHVAGAFFDFSTSRNFNLADGSPELQRAVEDSSNTDMICADGQIPPRIPIYFSRIAGVDSRMSEWLAKRDRSFLLAAGESDSIYQAGSDEFPPRGLRPDEVSPAFGLIRAMPQFFGVDAPEDGSTCRDDDPRPRCWRQPLALVWSAKLDPLQSSVTDVGKCRGGQNWAKILWGMTPFGAEDRYESCPPVLTLNGVDLYRDLGFVEKYGDPTAVLAERFVLVGADLAGLNDQVATPLHDHLPGVYKHAVALGALMRYGAHYPTVPAKIKLGLWAALIYLLLEIVREVLRMVRMRFLWMEFACFALAFALCVALFSLVVYVYYWPASLILAVFADYAGVVMALFLASRAKAEVAKARMRPKSGGKAS